MTLIVREVGRILGCWIQTRRGIVRMKTASHRAIACVGTHQPHVWPTGTARSRATCASAVSTAYAFSTAVGKARARGSVRAPAAAVGTRQDADEPEEHVIEATLTADGDKSIVFWEERGMPLDLLSAYGAGVQLHVEDLADHLAGREPVDDAEARWDELHPAYQGLAANLS